MQQHIQAMAYAMLLISTQLWPITTMAQTYIHQGYRGTYMSKNRPLYKGQGQQVCYIALHQVDLDSNLIGGLIRRLLCEISHTKTTPANSAFSLSPVAKCARHPRKTAKNRNPLTWENSTEWTLTDERHRTNTNLPEGPLRASKAPLRAFKGHLKTAKNPHFWPLI